MERLRNSLKVLLVIITFLFCEGAIAAVAPDVGAAIKSILPGSTQPGVVSKTLSGEQEQPTSKAAKIHTQEEQGPGPLGPEAEKIKFKLTKIILEDNHVYSDQQLEQIYKDKLNTTISIAELQNIVLSITHYYRNNGYILSRAILPPQHVKNGVVTVRIIEGYIDQVRVIGKPKGAEKLLLAYGCKIAASRPTQIKVMEYYLRFANEIPGMQVKALLEPSKTKVGASDLNLAAEEQTLTGSFSYDNYGTLYMGPQQMTARAGVNSWLSPGDTTNFIIVRTPRPKELSFMDLSYGFAIDGATGARGTIGSNQSYTRPSLNLKPLKINGKATTYYGLFSIPVIRSRSENLTLDGTFNYLNSQVTTFNLLLYEDRVRALRFGANYDFADRFNGSNLIGLHASQGLNILGATSNTNSTTLSRVDGHAVFTKVDLQISRLQALFWRFSAFFIATGQYAFNPLLVSEQFAYGGSQLGRGYDPAEIIGDKGAAGSIELRMDTAPGLAFLQSFQPYIFYDMGAIWNIKNVPNVQKKQSATSTGAGVRFIFIKNLSGNLMISQPLTKVINAESVVGRGRQPRVQFSIIASV